MKKSKTFDDKAEGLYKLKSLVSEPAAKDIVVQTSKGTMVFQGISRKFTRKLAEWEKAKGIGPGEFEGLQRILNKYFEFSL
jgi:hypothetical protein